ncbi:MAG: hypothetical protein K2W96_02380 [Gemmataceae bacterium]|nr:hypothetical protein [Gemmataceae bacterium]
MLKTCQFVASLILIGLLLGPQSGCDRKQREQAASSTSITGGALIATRHPWAMVAGVTLVVVGEGSKVVLTFVDGTEAQE